MNKHASLNKLFRVVWSATHNAWVAVAEHVAACGKGSRSKAQRAALLAAIGAGGLLGGVAAAAPPPGELPTGGQVMAGNASIATAGSSMNIQQGSQRAVIDWQTFNVGSAAQVNFRQPTASSVTLNRVQDNNATQIAGRITANGQVIISNPNGVLFAPGASVDVGALTATTHQISVADFMDGNATFNRNGSTGAVINQGQLKAALGGYIALLAPEVRNEGIIIANLGTVALAAGESFELRFDAANSLAGIRVTPATIKTLVENRSVVLAPGGLIILSAQAADRLQGGVIRNSGRLEASGLQQRGGRIVLEASSRIENTGSIDASATAAGPAGSIQLSAPEVVNSGSLQATGASGQARGGEVAILAGNFTQTAGGRVDVGGPGQGGRLSVAAAGKVELAGEINAAGDDGSGGEIAVQAAQIELADARVDASGAQGGSIRLDASAPAPAAPLPDAPVREPGKLAINGNSTLATRGRRGQGGNITLLGDDLSLNDSAALDASGATGGGNVLVGGDWQGSNGFYQATTVTMAEGASIDASASEQGDGGKVVLWADVLKADSATAAHGSLSARGGANGGSGGRIETSGASLAFDGIRIDTQAADGSAGQWLLDPYNFFLGASELNTIAANLSGGNITLSTAGSSGGGASADSFGMGHLVLQSDFNYSGSNTRSLTLTAEKSIWVNGNITATGSGGLGLTFNAGERLLLNGDISTKGGWVSVWADTVNFQKTSGAQSINTAGGSLFFNTSNIELLRQSGSGTVTIDTGAGALNIGSGSIQYTNTSYAISSPTLIYSGWGGATNNWNGLVSYGINIVAGKEYTTRLYFWDSWDNEAGELHVRRSDGGYDYYFQGYRYGGLSSVNLYGNGAKYLASGESSISRSAWNDMYVDVTFVAKNSGTLTTWTNLNQDVNDESFELYQVRETGFSSNSGYNSGGRALTLASTTGQITGSKNLSGLSALTVSTNNTESALGGVISGATTLTKSGTGTLTLTANQTYGGATTIDAGTLVLQNDAPTKSTSGFGGTGALRIEPATAGFSSAFSTAGWSFASTLGGLTIGKSGNTADVTLANALSIDGSIAVYGRDVTVNSSLGKSAGSATSDLLLQATRHVSLGGGSSISASGGKLNVKLVADANNDGDGIIWFAAPSASTNGGYLQFGNNQTATINGQSVLVGGDVFFNSNAAQTIDTGSGAFTIYGEAILANASAQGVSINTGGGAINFAGVVNSGNQYSWVNKTASASSGSWDDARAEAKAGNTGNGSAIGDSYLVTITSRLENALAGLAAGYRGAWIGAYRSNTNNYDWVWADGPEANQQFFTQRSTGGGSTVAGYYSNFGTGEPNGRLSGTRTDVESVGQFFGTAGLWNDLAVSTTYSSSSSTSQYAVLGYVRETNLAPSRLALNAGAGTVTFNGAVGGSKALASLNVSAASTTVNGTALKTAGAQTYDNALTVTAGGDLNVAATTLSITGAAQSLLFKATGSIVHAPGMDLTVNGGNVTYWADSDGAGGGNISLTGGALVQTGGGGIWMGGGLGTTTWKPQQSGTAITVASGKASGAQYGINIENSALDAGTGNVWLSGASSFTTGDYGVGVRVYASGSSNSAAISGRDISLTGVGGAGSGAYAGYWGVGILAQSSGTTSVTASGALNITGTGGGGASTGGGNHGVLLSSVALSSAGNLAITGSGGGKAGGYPYNDGIHAENATLGSGAGSLTLTGTKGLNASSYGLGFYTANTIGNASSQSGNIVLRADTASLVTSLLGTGTATIEPLTTAFTSGFSTSGLVLGSDLAGLTLGKAGNTGDITVASGYGASINGPISLYGGNITLGANLASTASSGGNISLVASGNIVSAAAGLSISTAGGNILLAGDSDNSGAGEIALDRITLSSTGGNITLGGGDASGSGYAVGANAALAGGFDSAYRGIWLHSSSLDAGGGNIALRGKGWQGGTGSSGHFSIGVDLVSSYVSGSATAGNRLQTTGSGSISIDGIGGRNYDANNHAAGINLFNEATSGSNRLSTVNGDITLTGTSGTGAARVLAGINQDGGGVDLVSSQGNVSLRGIGSGAGVQGISTAGTFNLGGNGTTNTSGSVTLTGDRIASGGTYNLRNSGGVLWQPDSASFASAQTWDARFVLIGDKTGLTIGKTTNTADVTVASATSIAGPIGIYGGSIHVDEALTASGSNTITLKGSSTGTVTDGNNGYLSAANLLLLGGNVTLDHASNAIGTLAASGIGSLSYVDSDQLTIGTVGSTNGISAMGTLSIGTQSGDLTVAKDIATANATADALVLNAGIAAAAGSDSGGNILITGTPTISVGAGGRASFFTGSIADSTGLTGLIGSGSGRFRYNSDEAASNFTLALAGGKYAIYRQAPTLTVKADDQEITYGDSPALTTTASVASGDSIVNGDTLAMALPGLPSALVYGDSQAVTTVGASANGTAYYDVIKDGNGNNLSYTLRVGTVNSALGYVVSKVTGSLTVKPKGLLIQTNDDAKFAIQSDPAGYQGVSTVGLASGEKLLTLAAGDKYLNAAGTEVVATGGESFVVPGDLAANAINLSNATHHALGTLVISRSDASNNAVGDYMLSAGALAFGNNYDTAYVAGKQGYQAGNFSIVAADKLLVRVANSRQEYGEARAYTVTGNQAEYVATKITVDDATDLRAGQSITQGSATATIVSISDNVLTLSKVTGEFVANSQLADGQVVSEVSAAQVLSVAKTAQSGNSVTFGSPGNTATFTIVDPAAAATAKLDVGSYALGAGSVSYDGGPIAGGVKVVGNVTVTPRQLTLSGTKVYDGSTAISGVTLGNLASDESLGQSGVVLSDRNVGDSRYVRAITLADGGTNGAYKASNYVLPDLTTQSAGNTVAITPRPLSVAAAKVYDGSAALDAGAITFGALSGDTASGLVAGESLTVTAATGSSSHVAASDKYISKLTLSDGNGLVSNYSLQGLSLTSGTEIASGLSYVAGVNTLSIDARPLSVALSNTDVSKVYDGSQTAKVGDGVSANAYFTPIFVIGNAAGGDSFALGTGSIGAPAGDPVSGTFTWGDFTYSAAYDSANVVGASAIRLSNIALTGLSSTVGSQVGDYRFWDNSASVVASITPRPVAVSGTGVSKVYDGTTAMTGVSVGFTSIAGRAESGVVSGQSLTVSGGVGAFDSANAGTNVGYTLSSSSEHPLVLAAGGTTLASNYSIPGGGAGTIAGNDGIIYKRALSVTFTGDAKVYDGTTSATVSVSYSGAANAPVAGDDVFINRSAVYDSKDAGSGASRVTVSGVSLGGSDLANYTLIDNSLPTYNTTASGTITQRDSVTWVGGASGDWFTASNWAATSNLNLTGVLPDLANVANVVIPTGTAVVFNGASQGAVNIASLQGSGTTLDFPAGILNIGSGGALLSGFNQSAGALSSTGLFSVSGVFSQTDGTLTTTGSGAHVSITQASGDLSWKSITSGGNLTLSSPGKTAFGITTVGGNLISTTRGAEVAGGVTQSGKIEVTGTAEFIADTGASQDASLTLASNDFHGEVSFYGANAGSWRTLSLTDSNALALGTVTATSDLTLNSSGALNLGTSTVGGNLSANSHGGNITQSGALSVVGSSTLAAGTGDITLGNAANDFAGTVNASGANVSLTDRNALTLGAVSTTGNLTLNSSGDLDLGTSTVGGNLSANSHDGDITQGGALSVGGSSTLSAGTGDITLTNAANDFAGAVNAAGVNVSLTDADDLTLGTVTATGNLTLSSNGDLDLGTSTVGGNLSANSHGGDITQSGALSVGGSSTLTAGTGDITLTNAANDFAGTVDAAGANVSLTDSNALTLGTVSTTGNLTLNSGGDLDLGTSTVGGNLSANSHGGDITQSGALSVAGSSTLTAGTGDITLENANNDFGGTFSAQGNNIAVVDGTGDLLLGDIDAAGQLDVTATHGNLAFNGDVTADSLTAAAAGNITQAESSTLTVANDASLNAGGSLTLDGALTAGDTTLTAQDDVTLNGTLSVAALEVTATTGDLAFNGQVTADSLTAAAAGNITQAESSTLTVANDASLTAGGSLTLDGALTAGDTTLTAQDDVTLNGTLTVAALEVTATAGDLAFNGQITADSLTAEAAGNITQAESSTLTVANDASLNAGGSLTLDGALTAGDTTLTARDDVTLNGTLTVAALEVTATTGDLAFNGQITADSLTAEAAGNITQAESSTLTVANDASLNAGGSITLDGALNAGDTTLTAQDDVTLNGTLTVAALEVTATTGDLAFNGQVTADSLTAAAAGDIGQGEGATLSVVAGPTVLSAGGDIALTQGNDFNGPVNASAINIALNDVNGMTLGMVTAAGNLDVSSHGALDLGTSTVGGKLNVSSGGGDITQSGALTVTGSSVVDAGSGNITLTDPANDFAGRVDIEGGNVALSDANTLLLGSINAAGSLDVDAGGDITQTDDGAIIVAGASTLAARDAYVRLTSPLNSFVGGLKREDLIPENLPVVLSPAVLPPTTVSTSGPQVDTGPLAGSAGGPQVVASLGNGIAVSQAIEVLRLPAGDQSGLVSVKLPQGALATGFEFSLPVRILEGAAAGDAIAAQLPDGKPLPSWLRFNPETRRFLASALPADALPLEVMVDVGGRKSVISISGN